MTNFISSSLRVSLLTLLVSLTFSGACSDDNDNASSPDAQASSDAAGPDADPASLCYPEGIYGSCGDLGCGNCLRGATIYQVCSSGCTQNSDCGAVEDFAGANPLCAPLNPGSTDMICVLTCLATDECPCGLECRESGVQGVKICAETL